MSYEPTNWKSGDTITSAKLNKLENGLAEASGGGGGGVLIVGVEMDETTMTLDKTWREIHDAPLAIVAINTTEGEMTYKANGFIGGVQGDVGIFSVYTFMAGISASTVSFDPLIFSTTTENGYPVADIPE